jgi:hypothetical protein
MTDSLIDGIAALPQTSDSIYLLSYPAASGEVVTEGHARYCRDHGHAAHTVNGVPSPRCPRCGESTVAEGRSFYANQPRNTSAVYVDGFPVEMWDDEPLVIRERATINRYRESGHRYIERVVFGHGRVALIFKTQLAAEPR